MNWKLFLFLLFLITTLQLVNGQSLNRYVVKGGYDSLFFIKKNNRVKKILYYDEYGRLRRKEKRDVFNNIHGKIISFDSLGIKSVEKFKRGIPKVDLKQREYKRQYIYYSYGMVSGWWGSGLNFSCRNKVELKYGYTKVSIAGCVVSKKAIRRSWIRNSGNDFLQFFRFGPNWKVKMKEEKEECET